MPTGQVLCLVWRRSARRGVALETNHRPHHYFSSLTDRLMFNVFISLISHLRPLSLTPTLPFTPYLHHPILNLTGAKFCYSLLADARFTSNPPSMVAAAAVASAIQGVLHRHEIEDEAAAVAPLSLAPRGDHTSAQQYMQDLYDRLHDITQIDTVRKPCVCVELCSHTLGE